MNSELQAQPLAGVLATSQLLDILKLIFPKKNRQKINQHLYTNYRNYEKSLDLKGLIISYAGQPGGIGYQHEWNVDATQASAKVQSIFRDYLRSTSAIVPTPTQAPSNQGQNARIEWHGLFFRSPTELKIAKALDQRNLLFFPNARCRIPSRNSQQTTIEVDFLIVHQGKLAILEVDGATYHPSAAVDHQRDRLFLRQGILCSRFTAQECEQNSDEVVAEFLELIEAFIQNNSKS